MKIASIVGARPQFVKAAPLSRALTAAGHEEILIHTGQHYDYLMSQVFFDELGIRAPDLNLEVGSGSHAKQTGEIMIRLEEALIQHRPDRVVIFGDTNSTLAGAITTAKLRIPLAHVEAGLRSFNMDMPEEQNRVLSDHCSDLLFCPTETAVKNLQQEGLTRGVHMVGDPMYDALRIFSDLPAERSRALVDLNLRPREYLLATMHRPYNTDVAENLTAILEAFMEIGEPLIFPAHPRARKQIDLLGDAFLRRLGESRVIVVEPVGYLDMLHLERNARLILTDSGGVQKEAYIFGVPCITLRPETEWVETVETGWSVLSGPDRAAIVRLAKETFPVDLPRPPIFGDGYSAERIVELLQ